jgi:hypothetical protein
LRAETEAEGGSVSDRETRGDGDVELEIVDVRVILALGDCAAVCVFDADCRTVRETLASTVSLAPAENVNADALLLRVGAERLAVGDVTVERDALPEFDADPEYDAESDRSADSLGLSELDVDHDAV